MRPLLEEVARERQRALIAEGARLAQARLMQAPVRFRSRRALARGLYALAERVDVGTSAAVQIRNA